MNGGFDFEPMVKEGELLELPKVIDLPVRSGRLYCPGPALIL